MRIILPFVIALLLAAAGAPCAFAAPDGLAPAKGSILVRYSKENASYEVFRIFDYAVERDGVSDRSDGSPVGYAIRETVPSGTKSADAARKANPWWRFLTTYGPDGKGSETPYAVLSSEKSRSKKDAALFVIDDKDFSLEEDGDSYHLVMPSEDFEGAWETFIASAGRATDTGTDVALKSFVDAALSYAKDADMGAAQGRYLAVGRETFGKATSQTDVDSVYQYSGDTAYVANVPLGLYLIDVDEGTLRSLDLAASSTLLYDKNERPELFTQVRAKGSTTDATDDGGGRDDLVWSEDNFMEWAYRRDVNLGELVELKTVIIAKQGITDYRLHDVMEEGLTFVDDAAQLDVGGDGAEGLDLTPRVYLYSQTADETYEIPDTVGDKVNWVLHKPGDSEGAPKDGCDFEVEFRDVAKSEADDETHRMTFALEDGDAVEVLDWDRIVVTFWARANEDAVVFGSDEAEDVVEHAKDLSKVKGGSAGKGKKLAVQTHTKTNGNERNTNNAVVTYGDDSHTTWARSEIATYQFDIARTDDAADGAAYPLVAGSKLSLYRDLGPDAAGATKLTVDVNRRPVTYAYDPTDPIPFTADGLSYAFVTDERAEGEGGGDTTLVTSDAGPLNVRGIEAGTYLLVEDDAPQGHARLAQPIVVTVHNRAYTNNDIVEDSTPGSRHSNEEGDVTITVESGHGTTTTEVYGWHAETSGSPATYMTRGTGAQAQGAGEPELLGEEATATSDGVAMVNGGVLAIGWVSPTGPTGSAGGVAAVVLALLAGGGAVAYVLRRRQSAN